MKIRHLLFLLPILLGSIATVHAEMNVGIGISLPGVQIGINMPSYPRLVPVPGYPVYYDPQASSNYFFYDGLYWVYQGDNWYASSWYNGPWQHTEPEYVPLFVLRVPVRYYRRPPVYFRGWSRNAPPRWGDHWGHDWEVRHRDWNRWDRKAAPHRAPLPSYQRQYSGTRYPQSTEQQRVIRSDHYRYAPHEAVTKQNWQQPANRTETRSESRQRAPEEQRRPPNEQLHDQTRHLQPEPISRPNESNRGRNEQDRDNDHRNEERR